MFFLLNTESTNAKTESNHQAIIVTRQSAPKQVTFLGGFLFINPLLNNNFTRSSDYVLNSFCESGKDLFTAKAICRKHYLSVLYIKS